MSRNCNYLLVLTFIKSMNLLADGVADVSHVHHGPGLVLQGERHLGGQVEVLATLLLSRCVQDHVPPKGRVH